MSSRIQSAKYNPIRRSTIIYPSQSLYSEGEPTVLKSKIDYSNRISHASSIGICKNIDKMYSQAQYNTLVRKNQLQMESLKQEHLKQRQIIQVKNEQYLSQLVQALNIICKNASALQDYLKLQKGQLKLQGKDIQNQYRCILQRLELQRKRSVAVFSFARKTIINPQNTKQKFKLLSVKRVYDFKITPQKQWLTFTSHSTRNISIDSQKERHNFKKQQCPQAIILEKHRYQQKMKVLEKVVSDHVSNRIKDNVLIQQLNEAIVVEELQLLNLKLKSKYGVFY